MSATIARFGDPAFETEELTLAGMASGLAVSAADSFARSWSHQLEQFVMISGGLASGFDESAKDFAATEQATIDALISFVESLGD